MFSNERSSSRLAVTSRYSVSMTASRSPSSGISAPVVVLIVRMLCPEALDGARLVGVDLDEILRPGHRQHRLDPLLDAGQLEVAAGAVDLAIEVHETANRGAVHVRDRPEIDEDLAVTGRDQAADRRRKVGK